MQGCAPGADDSLAAVQETTEKMVRKQLQSRLGVDLSDRKAFIKEQVRQNLTCSTFNNAQSLIEMPACLSGNLDLSAVNMAMEI